VRLLARLGAIAVCTSVLVACGGRAPLHSVRDVKATFAEHGLKLAVVDRNHVSTALLPAKVVRAWRRTPALGRPARPKNRYIVVVYTDRRWLHDLSRHQREAERVVGGGRVRWSQFSSHRDNVFIVYPAGAPKNLARLNRILDDI